MEWVGMDDWGGFLEGEDEDTATQPARETQRDAILFLIDSQPSMFELNEDGVTPFSVAVQCAMQFYKDKVVSSESDYVGLLLYATNHRLNTYNFDGVYIFHQLARPSAQRIKELENLIVNKQGYAQHVGSADTFQMADALWAAQHLFYSLPKNVGYKRIMVFTNDDDPSRGDANMRDKCTARARDLAEAEVALQLFAIKKGLPHEHEIAAPPGHGRHSLSGSGGGTGTGSGSDGYAASEPLRHFRSSTLQMPEGTGGALGASLSLHIPKPVGSSGSASGTPAGLGSVQEGGGHDGKSFNSALFWRDLMYVTDDDAQQKAIHLDAGTSFSDMLEPLKRKTHQKRSFGQLRVAFGTASLESAPTFAVKIYAHLMPAKKGTALKLDAKTNTPLVTSTEYVCRTTAALLDKTQDIEHTLTVKNHTICFSADDAAAMKAKVAGPPGLRILGFKPKEVLKLSHQLDKPVFLRPDDADVIGSTRAFRALVTNMLEKDKVAIAQLTQRKGAAPRLVALIPQDEVHDPDGNVDEYCGLYAVHLPYADDIRSLSTLHPCPTEKPANHGELVKKAKQIVRKMQLQPMHEGGVPCYDPYDYPNPALQKHYTVLQSVALEEDYDDVPDYTLPDYASMANFSDLFASYRDTAYAGAARPAVGGVKRSATQSDEVSAAQGGIAKKVRKRSTPTILLFDCSPCAPRSTHTQRQAKPGCDVDGIDFLTLHAKGSLGSLSIAVLKSYLQSRHVVCNLATIVEKTPSLSPFPLVRLFSLLQPTPAHPLSNLEARGKRVTTSQGFRSC